MRQPKNLAETNDFRLEIDALTESLARGKRT